MNDINNRHNTDNEKIIYYDNKINELYESLYQNEVKTDELNER